MPWVASDEVLSVIRDRLPSALVSGRLDVNVGGGSVTLNASDIEIGAVELKNATTDDRAVIQSSAPSGAEMGLIVRNIPSGTQNTSAAQSGTWVLGANSGVDIGDVTINNASGASAVNIQDGGNSITVDGTVAATQSGTWILSANSGIDIGDVTINNGSGASAVNIQDGGNSITVDNAALSVTGGGVESTALRVTIANDSTGLLSVDDNGSSLTVDNAGTFAVQAAQSGTWTVQPGNTANTTAWLVNEVRPSSSSVTSVAASASNVTLLASTATRRGATFYNDSTSACYLKYGATASTSSFTVKIFGNGFHEIDRAVYTGQIDAIWDSATGNMRITELT